MLASGSDDYMAHGRCTPWDHAPVDLLCREAGCHAADGCHGARYHTGDSGPFMITANQEIWDHLAGTLWAGFFRAGSLASLTTRHVWLRCSLGFLPQVFHLF